MPTLQSKYHSESMKTKVHVSLTSLTIFAFLGILCASCNVDEDNEDAPSGSTENLDTVTDIEGNVYDIIEIEVDAEIFVSEDPPSIGAITGTPITQKWLKQNLRVTKLNDGTPLILNEGDEDMAAFHYCWYDDNEQFAKETVGAIYHESVVNSEKICPVGWKVPSDEDWLALEYALGMEIDLDMIDPGYRGDSISYKLKEMNSTFWDASNDF
jgi:uncharacterized protein (TIGR02145 family)